MTKMIPSLVEPGFYYEKMGQKGWLRLVVGFDNAHAVYADFVGIGACYPENLGRWAAARYDANEALQRFPDEVRKIHQVLKQHGLLGHSDSS
ncbi:hypothetical protein [Bradyrhizobium sp. CCBAU 11357]|uniref:hypothetical protein n=1 Tax=Bradyrhizobium sp. CCBAU 11357 TaxID=1630808 RepID=UPI002304281D|nr:hypothetical protein [Bradyrhizobium sp. CCBAU 11357]